MKLGQLALCLALLLSAAAVPGVAAQQPSEGMLTGVNIAGAEFNGGKIPGVINKNYVYPDAKTIDHFFAEGMNVFRIPFRWERLQSKAFSAFEAEELARLDKVVRHITAGGAQAILDPHNYGRYYGKKLGTEEDNAVFADFWKRLAERYKGDGRVIFGLMNEPHGIRARDWAGSAQAAIDAIRATGAQNLILVPGTLWTGAHSWTKAQSGGSNAEAMAGIADPVPGGLAFEVHQYLDRDYSGTSATCQSETIGVEKLRTFTAWLRETGSQGFLGEFAAGGGDTCLRALDGMLAYIGDNADVWKGWTYWAAGAWWGDYHFSVQPSPDGPKPQMEILRKHVSGR